MPGSSPMQPHESEENSRQGSAGSQGNHRCSQIASRSLSTPSPASRMRHSTFWRRRTVELKDPNNYNTGISGSIQPASIIETASAMRHNMKIDGKTVKFTARAGRLTAKGEGDTRAAIFYTAYTRDGLPHDKRPVTFFWNRGPGSASIWLHLVLGGQRASNPTRRASREILRQTTNELSLGEQCNHASRQDRFGVCRSPGSGLSTAIAPSTNQSFWGVDVDAQVIAGFITAYNNRYNRQSSPKYLYGKSMAASAPRSSLTSCLKADTANFEKDSSGKPSVVLNGIILNSPLLDYTHYCDMNQYRTRQIALRLLWRLPPLLCHDRQLL